jgi:hypothetical protein
MGWAVASRQFLECMNMKMPEQYISDLDAMKAVGAVMTLNLDPIQAWLLLCYLQASLSLLEHHNAIDAKMRQFAIELASGIEAHLCNTAALKEAARERWGQDHGAKRKRFRQAGR